MDNFLPPFPATTNGSSDQNPDQFNYYSNINEPNIYTTFFPSNVSQQHYQYRPLYLQYSNYLHPSASYNNNNNYYSPNFLPNNNYPQQPPPLYSDHHGLMFSNEQDQRRNTEDAWATKAARSKRRIARQKSLGLTMKAATSSSSSASSGGAAALGENVIGGSDGNFNGGSLYTFWTPDKKRLRAFMRKELRSSDVGSLGRIVIPKREAEENLPFLSDKEGIIVLVRDVYSYQHWEFKFKYWANNKSRMYVFENTGEFVKKNGLEIGDYITLYEDEYKNLREQYVSTKKAKRTVSIPPKADQLENHGNQENMNPTISTCNTSSSTTTTVEAKDEDLDAASIGFLLEQLENMKDQQEPTNLINVSENVSDKQNNNEVEYKAPYNILSKGISANDPIEMAGTEPLTQGRRKGVDDYQIYFEDCYGGLDTLPEVYYLFDHLNDGI